MTISEDRVKRLVEQLSEPLAVVAADVRKRLVWDFNLPVAVIDARQEPPVLMQSSVGSLGNVLRVSTKIDHPLIRQLFDIYPDRGSDAAIDEMLNGQHGKEFAEVFDEYQEDKDKAETISLPVALAQTYFKSLGTSSAEASLSE